MLKFGRKSDVNFRCTVRLLEDTDLLECEFHVSDKGRTLIDKVCEELKISEKDYFGLRYVDSTHQRHWLDPSKSIFKQVKDLDSILFSFRVKFYPPDPFRLKEDLTRNQLFLQLKRDLLHGRLYCSVNESALLAAYIIQVDFGDYDENEFMENYVSETKLLLKQTPQIEDKIMEIHHKELKGQECKTAEKNFLKKAVSLDTYGIDPHPVKKKHTIGFKCPTGAACRHVWRCAMEQMLFFTSPSSNSIPSVVTGGSFFSFGTKLRYSGRVEKEVLSDSVSTFSGEESEASVSGGTVHRKAISVPATPSTPLAAQIGSNSLPRTMLSADCRLDSTFRSQTISTFPESTAFLSDLEPLNETEGKERITHLIPLNDPCGMFPCSLRDSVTDSTPKNTGPVDHLGRGSMIPSSKVLLPTPSQAQISKNYAKRFCRIFVSSFFVVAIFVCLLFLLIFETDVHLLSTMRRIPELVILRVQYYEHLKHYFISYFPYLS